MALSLNKYFILCLSLVLCLSNFAQTNNPDVLKKKKDNEKDYQDKTTFDKFKKRSKFISAWQIQNLKFGAIVVRLQNNQRKVDAYNKIGDKNNAYQTIAKTQFLNKVMITSILKEVDFCKVYFIYAQNSDSLLNGKKQGIFLDSTLKVDAGIVMNENYFLLMETDYVYNSSIGFIKEDSARKVSEYGNKTVYAPLVMKNKYGHQLKDPFPFYTNKMTPLKKSQFTAVEKIEVEPGEFKDITIELKREYSEAYWRFYSSGINYNLHRFYERNAGVQIKDPLLKPFLY